MRVRETRRGASEIEVRAERKAGDILLAMPKNEGVRTVGGDVAGGHSIGPRDDAPALADLGISKNQSAQWQEVARVPEPIFEAAIAEAVSEAKAEKRNGVVTTAAVMRKAEARMQEWVMDTVRDVVLAPASLHVLHG